MARTNERIQQDESHGVLPSVSHSVDNEVQEADIEWGIEAKGEVSNSTSSG